MSAVVVPYAEVLRAAATWERRSESLHGAVGTAESADVASLGPRVRSAAAAFLDHWAGAVAALESDAADHAAALRAVRADAAATDVVVAGDLGGLLRGAGAR